MVVSHIDYTMQYGEDEEPKEVSSQDNLGLELTRPVFASRMTLTTGIFRIWNKHSLFIVVHSWPQVL
jgi:hypothetical protein